MRNDGSQSSSILEVFESNGDVEQESELNLLADCGRNLATVAVQLSIRAF